MADGDAPRGRARGDRPRGRRRGGGGLYLTFFSYTGEAAYASGSAYTLFSIAAVVLGISRAVGETMIVAIAAGQQARIVENPLELGQTMTGFIANAALGDARVGSLEYDTLYAVGLLLFTLTLIINFISIAIVRRFREAY